MSAGAQVRPGGPGRPLPTGPAAPAARPGQPRAGGGRACETRLPGSEAGRGEGGWGARVLSSTLRQPLSLSTPPPLFHRNPLWRPLVLGLDSVEEPFTPPQRPRREDHLMGALPSVVSRWRRCAEGDSGAPCLTGCGSNVRMCPVPWPLPGSLLLSGANGALGEAPRGWKGRGLQVISCRSAVSLGRTARTSERRNSGKS